jgi:hypothetical protein
MQRLRFRGPDQRTLCECCGKQEAHVDLWQQLALFDKSSGERSMEIVLKTSTRGVDDKAFAHRSLVIAAMK